MSSAIHCWSPGQYVAMLLMLSDLHKLSSLEAEERKTKRIGSGSLLKSMTCNQYNQFQGRKRFDLNWGGRGGFLNNPSLFVNFDVYHSKVLESACEKISSMRLKTNVN